jgi:hypothetical protein
MVDNDFQSKHHHMWSDGCFSQFKSKIPWFFVNYYRFVTGGCSIPWSFFGTSDGKGSHDGTRAILKQFIR